MVRHEYLHRGKKSVSKKTIVMGSLLVRAKFCWNGDWLRWRASFFSIKWNCLDFPKLTQRDDLKLNTWCFKADLVQVRAKKKLMTPKPVDFVLSRTELSIIHSYIQSKALSCDPPFDLSELCQGDVKKNRMWGLTGGAKENKQDPAQRWRKMNLERDTPGWDRLPAAFSWQRPERYWPSHPHGKSNRKYQLPTCIMT